MDLPDGSRICLFNEPSGVTPAMIQAAQGTARVAIENRLPAACKKEQAPGSAYAGGLLFFPKKSAR